MRRLLGGLILGFVFLLFGISDSYADMCRCMDDTGGGTHERGMHMMEGMRHRGAGMTGPGQHMRERFRDLGLEDTQKTAIREIRGRAAKEAIRKRADLQIARMELKDILRADPVDMKAAETKLKQVEALKTDLDLSRIKTLEEIREKLTPDQRKKLMSDWGGDRKWGRCGRCMSMPMQDEE